MREIGLEINILSKYLNREFGKLESLSAVDNMTGSNSFIIIYLAECENHIATQNSIKKKFNVTRSTISSVLTKMETKGIILRLDDTEDKRIKKVKLTDFGYQLYEILLDEVNSLENCLKEGFSLIELKQLFSFIDRIKENLQNRSRSKNV